MANNEHSVFILLKEVTDNEFEEEANNEFRDLALNLYFVGESLVFKSQVRPLLIKKNCKLVELG